MSNPNAPLAVKGHYYRVVQESEGQNADGTYSPRQPGVYVDVGNGEEGATFETGCPRWHSGRPDDSREWITAFGFASVACKNR